MTKVLVCGGRDYNNTDYVFGVLDGIDALSPITTIVHGNAKGADTLADQWAWARGVTVKAYPAKWNIHGKSAGPLRNREMDLKEQPDMVVAFPGGVGTADMVSVAKVNNRTLIDLRNVNNQLSPPPYVELKGL